MIIKILLFYVEINFISSYGVHSLILWITDEKSNSNFIPLHNESHLFLVSFWEYFIRFSISVHKET